MSTMHEAVVRIVSTRFNMDVEKITHDATFDELELDSLAQLELVTALEDQLGIAITDDELAEMSTVSEIVTKLEEKGTGA